MITGEVSHQGRVRRSWGSNRLPDKSGEAISCSDSSLYGMSESTRYCEPLMGHTRPKAGWMQQCGGWPGHLVRRSRKGAGNGKLLRHLRGVVGGASGPEGDWNYVVALLSVSCNQIGGASGPEGDWNMGDHGRIILRVISAAPPGRKVTGTASASRTLRCSWDRRRLRAGR